MNHFPFKFYQHRARVFALLLAGCLIAYFLFHLLAD